MRCRHLVLPAAVLFITISFSVVGCQQGDRPPLGRVRGTVTVDGAPAAGVGVIFSQEGYRSSSGLTDAAGEYELTYIRDVKGAVVGLHRVRIDVFAGEGKARKRLPARYNRQTELTADVQRGRNRFDFDLESSVPDE